MAGGEGRKDGRKERKRIIYGSMGTKPWRAEKQERFPLILGNHREPQGNGFLLHKASQISGQKHSFHPSSPSEELQICPLSGARAM